MKKISIIIPVYNERTFIETLLKRVVKIDLGKVVKEVIIIDDGSTDGTNEIIRRFTKNNRSKIVFYAIFKKKNQGKGAALKEGFLKSKGDIVLVQDGDLEYDPVDYKLLLEPFIKNKADVVYGSRLISSNPHRVLYFWHYLGNFLLTTLSNILTNLNLSDMETGFKVFRGDLIRKIAPFLESRGFGFEPEITARIAKFKELRIYEVGISYSGRTYAEGKKITWVDGLISVYLILKYNLFR